MTPASTQRRMRRALVVVALVAIGTLLSVSAGRSELGWRVSPGRVGAPSATIALDGLTDVADADVRLAVLGDVGTGDARAWATARLVSEAGRTAPFDALVLLGDNVYPNGDPDRLDATIFEPFGPVLDQGTAVLAVLGNHDIRDGNAAGQMDALGMPGRWYEVDLGPVLIIGLDSNLTDDPQQQEWLEATLAAAESEWVIVAMHHPAYSAGFHGSTPAIQEAWVPVFEEHDVDLVLAGHDHDYQRTKPIGDVTYVVSGGGAKTRPTDRAEFTAYAASVNHYLDIGIWEDRIELTAHSADGPFDHVTIGPAAAQDSGG